SARERAVLLEREQMARQEAELQKQHLHALFTQAPTPIVILRGFEYVIELANPHALQVWGRPHEEVIHRPLFDALPELDARVLRPLLDGVMKTGVPNLGKAPTRLQRKTDRGLETVYFNFVYAPLRNVQGGIDGVLVIAFDVTEEVVAREQMRQLRGEAEA